MMMVVEEERSIEQGLLQPKDKNDDLNCRITASVIFSTFVAICGSFSFGVAFSAFGSFSTVGAAIGALVSGKMAMILGRRGTMWVSDILCITGWLSIAFAKDVIWLNFGRISSGMGLGLISYVVPVYIAEITPKHVRGTFTFSNQLLQNSGLAMVYFIGNFVSWRTLALLGALPCFLQAIGLFYVPESPRWLAKVGRDKELENSLRWLRGVDANISRETSEIQVGVGLMFIQQFSGSSAVFFYASTIIRKSGFSVAIGSTLLGFFMIPKAMIGLVLVDKWGRRPLLLTSAFGMSITCMLIGVAFTLQKMQLLPEVTPIFMFICVTVYLGTYAMGLRGLPWIIMSEIFPINIKVTAGSVVTLASWTSSSIVTYVFNFLFEWSTQGTFYIFGVIGGAAMLFIWLLVPETKGLSLEEIQVLLTRHPDQINHI